MSRRPFRLPRRKVEDFCRRHRVLRLSLFGSVLRGEDRPGSDLDLLVEFDPRHRVGLVDLAEMEHELSSILGGRRVDLRTPAELSRYFRDRVLAEAEVVHAGARGPFGERPRTPPSHAGCGAACTFVRDRLPEG